MINVYHENKSRYYYMMKRIIVIVLITVFITGISGQLSEQSNEDGSMPQYLFGEFSKSIVRLKNGQVQTTLMNYNMVTEKQFLKLFPGKEGQIKEYMKEYRLKFSLPDNLASVVRYINTLK
jgi:hypothetical protein